MKCKTIQFIYIYIYICIHILELRALNRARRSSQAQIRHPNIRKLEEHIYLNGDVDTKTVTKHDAEMHRNVLGYGTLTVLKIKNKRPK